MVKKKSTLKSAVIMRRKRRTGWLVGALVVIGVGALSASVVGLAKLPQITIQSVSVIGAKAVSADSIKALATSQMAGAYLYFIPKGNTFLYPRDAIQKDIADQFPRIKTLSVETKSRTTLAITVSERTPMALWCESQEGDAACYLMDETGFIFDRAPQFGGNPYMRYYGALATAATSTEGSMLGQTFDAGAPLADVKAFSDRLATLHITIIGVVHLLDGSLEFQVDGGGRVLTQATNLEETFGNVSLTFAERAKNKEQTSNFDYVDARFGNKVFWKQ